MQPFRRSSCQKGDHQPHRSVAWKSQTLHVPSWTLLCRAACYRCMTTCQAGAFDSACPLACHRVAFSATCSPHLTCNDRQEPGCVSRWNTAAPGSTTCTCDTSPNPMLRRMINSVQVIFQPGSFCGLSFLGPRVCLTREHQRAPDYEQPTASKHALPPDVL